MKLDSSAKCERTNHFLSQLKQKADIQPFLHLQEIPRFGIYDFCFINMDFITFQSIEKRLKEQAYIWFQDFVKDVRNIFRCVSDYAFHDDDIQEVCKTFLKMVDDFSEDFMEEFTIRVDPENSEEERQEKEELAKKLQQAQIAEEDKREIVEKLEMLYLFQNHESNPAALKLMVDFYGIGYETKDRQFIIDVDIESEFWRKYSNHTQY